MSKKKIKVLCAMSGGVDSSVAAALLKKDGYDVIGIFMKFWSEPLRGKKSVKLNKCCSIEAFMAAKKVAQILDIPLYTVNFKEAFKRKIVNNFLEEYQAGLTPNPCVRCNQFIKFGLLLNKMKQYGAQFVATGHYARVAQVKSHPASQCGTKVKSVIQNSKKQITRLLKGRDKNKDQTYFLYTLDQKKLKHILFPVGGYSKPQVRKLAERFKLPVAQKQESQELCFISEKDHYGFLRRYLKLKKGNIITVGGKKVGTHKGLPLYTIGQRKGIEIGGTGPYYVVELDFKNNRLIVTDDNKHSALLKNSLTCKKIHWISGIEPKLPLSCKARVRYRQEEVGAKICYNKETPLSPLYPSRGRARQGGTAVEYLIKFKKSQWAITAGQSVVFYKRNEVIGGGIII